MSNVYTEELDRQRLHFQIKNLLFDYITVDGHVGTTEIIFMLELTAMKRVDDVFRYEAPQNHLT